MSSFGHILVPKREIKVAKVTNLGCFGPKQYLKTPKAEFFFDQNYCWVEMIKEDKLVENLRWGRPW